MHIKPLFQQGPSIAARVLLGCVLALIALGLDYFRLLDPLKSFLVSSTGPVYWVADLPEKVSNWSDGKLSSRETLEIENARLELENLVLQSKVQQLAALTIENVRLRELLNSRALLEENVYVAEIISVSPDPQSDFVLLNKGKADGVFIGQAVIDANGLFGQVTEVTSSNSRVLLISDTRHAVPVQVNRNGVRMIAEGTGDYTELRLPHVALTTDIVVGDVLSTSGLGGVFPIGYPVARVTEVSHDPGQAFAIVKARPFASLDRTRHVLLLFEEKPE